jgi:ribosomal protein S18 acetylase RimI-like enzyme
LSYPYIPLLAVNPSKIGCGHGHTIVDHLIDVASKTIASHKGLQDVLYLDVYIQNHIAIALYEKHGFVKASQPEYDPAEGQYYYIMARRIPRLPTPTL